MKPQNALSFVFWSLCMFNSGAAAFGWDGLTGGERQGAISLTVLCLFIAGVFYDWPFRVVVESKSELRKER